MKILKSSTPNEIAAEILETTTPINQSLFNHYAKTLRGAVAKVYHDAGNPLFYANITRFAAYKACHATQQARREYVDENTGEVFDRRNTAPKILKQHQLWLATEANTATTRARAAKQWEIFNQPNRLRLFPNIKWTPSRSQDLREAHIPFYYKVWPKNHPFWASNMPGQLWNCKCGMVETREPATDNSDIPSPLVPAGLEGNPATTGEIFTGNASYFRETERSNIPLESLKSFKDAPNLAELFTHKPSQWRADYYTDNKGLLFVSRERIGFSTKSKETLVTFNKEYAECKVISIENKIELLPEKEGSFDIMFNGIPGELKKLSTSNNIVKEAKDAVRKKGASVIIFEFPEFTGKIQSELKKIKVKYGYDIRFFITGSDKLIKYETPPK